MTGPIPMPAKLVKFQRLVLIASWVCCSSTFGQQTGNNELAEGPFQQKREAMQELVRLKLNGNSLALRRKWNSTRNEDRVRNRMDAVNQVMKEQILDAENARRKDIAKKLQDHFAQKTYPNASLEDAFFAIAGGTGSHERASSESYSRFHFRTQTLSGEAELKDDRILFSFNELAGPEREFRVEDLPDGRFVFRYSGDDVLVELKQKPDGSIRIARIRGEQAEVFSAQHFAALRSKEPELIDQWLLPLFEHLGFSLPLEADDPAVRQAALTRLVASATFVTEDFRKLVADLDADDFSVRNTASETLQAQQVLYAEAISEELESESLSPEVRTRLASILTEPVVEDQVEELLREQKPLDSPEFLIGLLEIANESQTQALFKRLQMLTGEDYPDRKSWEEWLSKPKQNR